MTSRILLFLPCLCLWYGNAKAQFTHDSANSYLSLIPAFSVSGVNGFKSGMAVSYSPKSNRNSVHGGLHLLWAVAVDNDYLNPSLPALGIHIGYQHRGRPIFHRLQRIIDITFQYTHKSGIESYWSHGAGIFFEFPDTSFYAARDGKLLVPLESSSARWLEAGFGWGWQYHISKSVSVTALTHIGIGNRYYRAQFVVPGIEKINTLIDISETGPLFSFTLSAKYRFR